MQSFEDGTFHEDDEVPGRETLLVSRILGIDWTTSQSLKLGDNDYSPALLLFCAGKQPPCSCTFRHHGSL